MREMEIVEKNIIKFLSLCICLTVLFYSCKKKKQEAMEPFARVTLDANPSDDPTLDSVDLEYFVFESEQDFKNATATQNPVNFILSGSIKGSIIEIPQLASGVDHYILVRYYDTKTFPGFKILYTNEESNYLISALEKEAEMEANIKLKAQEGLFTFYSSNDNASVLPISITLANGTIATINTVNDKNLDNLHTVQLKKGKYSMKAASVGLSTCIWMKTAEIVAGANTLVEYESCKFGQVAFYSPVASVSGIKIFIGVGGQENLIGTLHAASSGIANCSDPNSVFTVLEPNKYSYFAYDEGTKCGWSDTFSLSNGACKMIELKNNCR